MPKMTPQQKLAQGLRNAAAWYDEHPDAPVEDLLLSAYIAGPDRSARLAAIGTGRDDFSANNTMFNRYIDGDGFTISFYCMLEDIAEQKVTGQQTVDVVEWTLKSND